MSENTGKQGGAPALPNNWTDGFKKPADDKAPNIGSPSFKVSPNDHNRGKDGTQK